MTASGGMEQGKEAHLLTSACTLPSAPLPLTQLNTTLLVPLPITQAQTFLKLFWNPPSYRGVPGGGRLPELLYLLPHQSRARSHVPTTAKRILTTRACPGLLIRQVASRHDHDPRPLPHGPRAHWPPRSCPESRERERTGGLGVQG